MPVDSGSDARVLTSCRQEWERHAITHWLRTCDSSDQWGRKGDFHQDTRSVCAPGPGMSTLPRGVVTVLSPGQSRQPASQRRTGSGAKLGVERLQPMLGYRCVVQVDAQSRLDRQQDVTVNDLFTWRDEAGSPRRLTPCI